jgi:hypothetical protein
MLDFLGLTDEANRLVICAVIAGFVGMIPGGVAMAGAKINKIVNGLCISVCCIAILVGLWPAVVLFFTFQWAVLLKALFFALLAGAVTGIPGFLIANGKRKKVYRNNPVMKEVVSYCKDNNIVGIQCYPDRLRFFSGLDSVEYCKSDNYETYDDSYKANSYASREKKWSPRDNDRHLKATFFFAQRGYPDLPDVSIFAEVLAQSLGGCRVVTHTESFKRDYFRYDKSTDKKELVHETNILYKDHFVYKTSALTALQKDKSKKEAQRRTEVEKNSKQWE